MRKGICISKKYWRGVFPVLPRPGVLPCVTSKSRCRHLGKRPACMRSTATQCMLRLFFSFFLPRASDGESASAQDCKTGACHPQHPQHPGFMSAPWLLLQPSRYLDNAQGGLVANKVIRRPIMRTDPAMIVAWPMAFLGPGQTLLAMPSTKTPGGLLGGIGCTPEVPRSPCSLGPLPQRAAFQSISPRLKQPSVKRQLSQADSSRYAGLIRSAPRAIQNGNIIHDMGFMPLPALEGGRDQ